MRIVPWKTAGGSAVEALAVQAAHRLHDHAREQALERHVPVAVVEGLPVDRGRVVGVALVRPQRLGPPRRRAQVGQRIERREGPGGHEAVATQRVEHRVDPAPCRLEAPRVLVVHGVEQALSPRVQRQVRAQQVAGRHGDQVAPVGGLQPLPHEHGVGGAGRQRQRLLRRDDHQVLAALGHRCLLAGRLALLGEDPHALQENGRRRVVRAPDLDGLGRGGGGVHGGARFEHEVGGQAEAGELAELALGLRLERAVVRRDGEVDEAGVRVEQEVAR